MGSKVGHPKRPPGRRRRSRYDAPEFGRLVEAELAKGFKVEQAMENIHRRKPGRWGGRSKAFTLWAEYQTHKANKAEGERRYAQVIADIAAQISGRSHGFKRRLGALMSRIFGRR